MDIHSARLLAQTVRASAGQPSQSVTGSADVAQSAHFRAQLQPDTANGATDSPQAAGSIGDMGTARVNDAAAAAESAAAADAAVPGISAELAGPAGAARPQSLGDAILRGLEKVRGSLDETLTTAQSLIDPQQGPVSTARLLDFQLSMLHMGFQYQMVTGVVTKTAQNIDQLVKMQ